MRPCYAPSSVLPPSLGKPLCMVSSLICAIFSLIAEEKWTEEPLARDVYAPDQQNGQISLTDSTWADLLNR